ncbi:MAG: phage tail protein [Pseudomonadota bacterium]
MANPVFSPPVAPQVGTVPSTEVKVLAAAFGDGYEQTQPDGLNHIRRLWNLTWVAIQSRADADAIEAFFVARGGSEVFDYQIPGEAAVMQFRCPTWTPPRDVGGGVWAVTARFRQAFDVTA